MEPLYEWVVSRVCDEFKCLPSMAIRELEHDPALVFDILELRNYASAKAALDHAKDKSDVKVTPTVQMVFDVMAELMKDGPKVS